MTKTIDTPQIKSLKKVAKSIKMPIQQITTLYVYWHKRGGYAGQNIINKVKSEALLKGWKKRDLRETNTPDGSIISNNQSITDPTKTYELVWSNSYGTTKASNRYTLFLKVINLV